MWLEFLCVTIKIFRDVSLYIRDMECHGNLLKLYKYQVHIPFDHISVSKKTSEKDSTKASKSFERFEFSTISKSGSISQLLFHHDGASQEIFVPHISSYQFFKRYFSQYGLHGPYPLWVLIHRPKNNPQETGRIRLRLTLTLGSPSVMVLEFSSRMDFRTHRNKITFLSPLTCTTFSSLPLCICLSIYLFLRSQISLPVDFSVGQSQFNRFGPSITA